MSYRFLMVYQGGPKDGCTYLDSGRNPAPGYEVFTWTSPGNTTDVEVVICRQKPEPPSLYPSYL